MYREEERHLFQNRTKPVTELCGHNLVFLNATPAAMKANHCTLGCYRYTWHFAYKFYISVSTNKLKYLVINKKELLLIFKLHKFQYFNLAYDSQKMRNIIYIRP